MYFTSFCSSIINTILIVTCKTNSCNWLHWFTSCLHIICSFTLALTPLFYFYSFTLCQYEEQTWCVLSRSASGAWIFVWQLFSENAIVISAACRLSDLVNVPLLCHFDENPRPDWRVWRCCKNCKSDSLCWLHFSGSASSEISGCHGN